MMDHRAHQEIPLECACQCRQPLYMRRVVLCPSCVNQALSAKLECHKKALQEAAQSKDWCGRNLLALRTGSEEKPFNMSEHVQDSERLKGKLGLLRQQCGSLAVKVAAQGVKNEERRVYIRGEVDPSFPRQKLHRLYQALCDPVDGALVNSITSTTELVRVARFQWALQAFVLHRLDVGSENNEAKTTGEHRSPHGIGKIGGLPLPHAGPEIYGVLPPQELISALRLVASLTSTVARCLGEKLPHLILLRPIHKGNNGGDIADTTTALSFSEPQKESFRDEKEKQTVGTASTASLLSLMGTTSAWKRSAKQALARATGAALEEDATAIPPPSMGPSLVSQRLQHATSVILAEDIKSSSFYTLSCETLLDDQFAIGLQLLSHNVVALCIRAGVPVANLWPAEALLLNLHALWLHCQDQVAEIGYGGADGRAEEVQEKSKGLA